MCLIVKSTLSCYDVIDDALERFLFQDMKSKPQKLNSDKPAQILSRPPIVVVMGHIDHGKSTLLDYIRKTNIVAGEAGGITQHMGAYQAEHTSGEGKKSLITFIDTPGHAAFMAIRERGAKAADVAILVVSAEDGVKPQTLDALNAIKSQKIPYVVAINKIDKPNANIDRTKQSLGENEIYVEGWGGDIPCVPISALKGTGVNELLDMVMLVAELADLRFDPEAPASGLIVESKMDAKKGISATLLLKNGTLKTGTCVVSGGAFAPVRYIEDYTGKKIESASASTPVNIVGWNKIPPGGHEFATVEKKRDAEEMVESFEAEQRKKKGASAQIKPATENNAAANIVGDSNDKQEKVKLSIIIKADTLGSLDGIKHELNKIKIEKVDTIIVSEGIGNINENDVKILMGDPSVEIIGFNVDIDSKAGAMIERSPKPLAVKTFKIIYEMIEYVKNTLTDRIPKEYIEETIGRAKILALFSKEKDRQVIGGRVESGTISSGNDIKILRRDIEIGRGKVRELQSKKVRVSEVAEGFEFGTMIESKIEVAAGDRIESVRTVEKTS